MNESISIKMSGAAGKRHQSGKTSARHTLMSALEDILNKETTIDMEEVQKMDAGTQITTLTQAIIDMNTKFVAVHNIINDASDGLEPRITDCDKRTMLISEENKQLRFELDMIKGLFIKSEAENVALKEKVTALSALHMKDNIIINGLCNDENAEDPVESVQVFLEEVMCLEVAQQHIFTARRMGSGVPGKPDIPRPMLVHVHPTLRELIFSNLQNLKGKLNDRQKPYCISKQLPEQWIEEKRQLNSSFQKAKKINENKKDGEQKDEIQIKGRTLYINKVPQKKTFLLAPKPADLFVDRNEQDKLDKIKFTVSVDVEDSGSTFKSYATKLQSITEVKRAYIRVKQIHPSATHIVAAYNMKGGNGFQDDREYGEGHRLLDIISRNTYQNTAVFIVRYHEGPNLGPRRHQLYERVTTEALARTKKL